MKAEHLTFLASDAWASMLRQDLLPWLLGGGALGDDVLEIGPGPGLTTDLLRELAPVVTAVELDPALAQRLSERFAGTHVAVVQADAAQTQFAASRFSAVTCFHMLHHVPSCAEQDAVFVEIARVLRPGGLFALADAMDIDSLRAAHLHAGETFVPVDPNTLTERLERAGFSHIDVQPRGYQLLVRARR